MNCKVQKYKFFPAEVSDLFATVAKDLYQINPGQNTLFFFFQDKTDYVFPCILQYFLETGICK